MSGFDVIGIGNAIVDVIAPAEDTFLDHMGIEKGIMQLIEKDRAEVLYSAMTERTETPGGSVANSIAGIGGLGLSTAFIGKVKDDALGRFYAKGMEDAGTSFPNAPVADAASATARSMIFVSPDGERSMNTYLGVSSELSEADVDATVMTSAKMLFLEGYLFDKDKGKAAFLRAAEDCHQGGGKSGISLSDPFCVDRHRDDFRTLVRDEMDYVIGNEDEWKSLYQVTDLDEALKLASADCAMIVCTRSGDGVSIVRGTEHVHVPVTPITPVDATGAGDQFAAGFLYGLATGRGIETCGRMGCVAAGEVISHIGPRPETDMKAMFEAEGLV